MSSVDKALSILELFNLDQSELQFSEVVRKTNFPKSTVHRILTTLRQKEYLMFDEARKQYSIGPKLFELGSLFFMNRSVTSAAIPEIEKLVRETHYTGLLASIVDDSLIYLFAQYGDSPLLVNSYAGQRRPPNYGILGKLLLAYLPEREVDTILEHYPLERTANNSITDVRRYKEELAKIRWKGYARADEETINGVSGFAAPIFDRHKQVKAGVALLYPTQLVNENEAKMLESKLLSAAEAISNKMGYSNYRREKE